MKNHINCNVAYISNILLPLFTLNGDPLDMGSAETKLLQDKCNNIRSKASSDCNNKLQNLIVTSMLHLFCSLLLVHIKVNLENSISAFYEDASPYYLI